MERRWSGLGPPSDRCAHSILAVSTALWQLHSRRLRRRAVPAHASGERRGAAHPPAKYSCRGHAHLRRGAALRPRRITWVRGPTRSRWRSDIRASTARRLARVVAVPVPRRLRRISRRWICVTAPTRGEFARAWVQIYDAIERRKDAGAAGRSPTPPPPAGARTRPLRLAAGASSSLHVPDCTGGG